MSLNVKNILAAIIVINILAVISFLFVGSSSQLAAPKSVNFKKEAQKNDQPHFDFLYDGVAARDNDASDQIQTGGNADATTGNAKANNNYQPPQNSKNNYPNPSADVDTTSAGTSSSRPATHDLDVDYSDPIDTSHFDEEIKRLSHSVNLHKEYADSLNPFRILGFYKDVDPSLLNAYPRGQPWYDKINLGLRKNPSYCDYSDLYNLFNPSNVFEEMNFVGDYTPSGLPRALVMETMGQNVMPEVFMTMERSREPRYDMDLRATMFFTKRVDFHYFHEIGKHFLCAGQMYGHIPGHGVITRKDYLVGSVNAYADSYADKPKCFNKNMVFPYAYRLNNATECRQFFTEINDQSYQERKKDIPLQYILKLGYGAHRAAGVFLFDEREEARLRDEYNNGEWCGRIDRSLLAQKYIGKPLTLDKNNKFDFRMYMLIASVDPVIAFYHDGFLRVSLQTYEFNSTDRNVHLTNTHLAKQTIANLNNATLEDELRDYQMWTMERLKDYLLKEGKIDDPDWLDNYLRPMFKKAFIHLIRMSKHAFWKHSSVYEMFGLDFMLDENLNLWFIEANASPQLIGTNPVKEKLMVDTLSDMFHIQYAYLRSKMKRMLGVIHKVLGKLYAKEEYDLEAAKKEFAEANRNYLEPEWPIHSNNTWHKIIDENLPGKKAYMGLIDDDCITDRE